jgi:hypothetical protein
VGRFVIRCVCGIHLLQPHKPLVPLWGVAGSTMMKFAAFESIRATLYQRVVTVRCSPKLTAFPSLPVIAQVSSVPSFHPATLLNCQALCESNASFTTVVEGDGLHGSCDWPAAA